LLLRKGQKQLLWWGHSCLHASRPSISMTVPAQFYCHPLLVGMSVSHTPRAPCVPRGRQDAWHDDPSILMCTLRINSEQVGV
jgi:hypothetical protein